METRSDVRFDADDPDEFAALVREFTAGPVHIETGRARGFHGRARAWGLPRASLFLVEMRGGRVVSPACPQALGLNFVLEGVFESGREGGTEAFDSGECLFVRDEEQLDIVVPSASVLVLYIDADLVEERARMLADAEPPAQAQCEARIVSATPDGQWFWRRITSVWRNLRAHAPFPPCGRATDAQLELADALADWMAGAVAEPAAECGADQLRKAEEFILAHLGDAISRSDISAAAGVGERSLSRVFARRHGVGPMSFLKQRRLDAAQRLLLAAAPAERSVTDVAMKYGLYHLGRFSVEYRRAFGESPSETLRR